MAAVNSTRGVKLVVKKLNTSVSPHVYQQICTINAQRGITFNAQTNDETIPDCADPDAIAWISREKQSLSVDVTGGGMNNKTDNIILWNWWKSPDSEPCQIVLDDDDPDKVITWEGNFHLTQYDMTGDRGQKVASTMTLSSDGEVTADFGADVSG
jgi:hypothetical protein